jgi:NitT/TauT family transport system ATP-binding protein
VKVGAPNRQGLAQPRRAAISIRIPSTSKIEESHSTRSAGVSPVPAGAPSAPDRGRNATLVRIASLQKSFGDLEAIRRISFDVGDGEFLGVLGPSGCGKSTLLMMIAGLIDPTVGEIWVKDAKVAGPRQEVGVVFQSPVLLPWRTVLQNVLFPIELQKLPHSKYRPRAIELLRMAKIDEYAGLLPRQLSGGMRQRVAICRALVHDPSILLMDEPFSALDAITRDEMAVELQRIWQANRKTVIFVTHSIREAAFLSDRVLVMGRRPATIIDELAIDIPRPRDIAVTEDENFNRLVRHLRKAIEASHAG